MAAEMADIGPLPHRADQWLSLLTFGGRFSSPTQVAATAMNVRTIGNSCLTQPLHAQAASRRVELRAAAALAAHALMQRAGQGLAQLALALAPPATRAWAAAAPGNSGGDGLEAASLLRRSGREVHVRLAADPARLPADAAASLRCALDAGVAVEPVAAGGEALPARLGWQYIAIDALLGLGATRAPSGAPAALVRQLGALPCPVLAANLPSGLNGDTGFAFGAAAVRASHILSLLCLKPGWFTGAGRVHAGQIWFYDLD